MSRDVAFIPEFKEEASKLPGCVLDNRILSPIDTCGIAFDESNGVRRALAQGNKHADPGLPHEWIPLQIGSFHLS